MLRVVGAETPAAELVLYLERAVLCGGDVLVLAVDGRVRPALWIEAVGAADQKVVRIRLGQHPYVVLTLVLRKREKMLLKLRIVHHRRPICIANRFFIAFCFHILISHESFMQRQRTIVFPSKKPRFTYEFMTLKV